MPPVDGRIHDRPPVGRDGHDRAPPRDEPIARRRRKDGADDRRRSSGCRRTQEKDGRGRDRGAEERSAEGHREPAAAARRGRGRRRFRSRRFLELDAGVGDVVEPALRVLVQAAAEKVAHARGRLRRQGRPVRLARGGCADSVSTRSRPRTAAGPPGTRRGRSRRRRCRCACRASCPAPAPGSCRPRCRGRRPRWWRPT